MREGRLGLIKLFKVEMRSLEEIFSISLLTPEKFPGAVA
jgi:hypothetical protein